MTLWFFKVVWFVLAAMWEGILLPSNMAAKTTFCFYLVKRLIVTLRCAVNVPTSTFQHFPWSLSAKIVFRKRKFISLNITFWSRDQLRTYSFYENGEDLKNQITIILLKIWPTNRFMKKNHITFIFIKTMSHDLFEQMAYLKGVLITIILGKIERYSWTLTEYLSSYHWEAIWYLQDI